MADEENNVDEEPKEEINEGEEEKKEEEPLLDSDGNPINPEDLKPKVPEAPLKLEMLRKSVKKLQRTYDGLSYAYTEIDLKEKEIDDLGTDIDNFTQILDFNVSTNKIPNINCVKNMPYIIRIDASANEIKDMDVFNNPERFQYLQILNLKTNKIHVLPEMQAVNLLQIDLSENKVKDCTQFKGLPNLKKLNLNTNHMANCIGLANCPKLEVLYLNNNRLTSIKGLDNLPSLRKLRLRANKIETFDDGVPNLPNLEKLAISENLIKKNVEFSKLKFPSLKRINIDGNPYFDESGANPKIEVLIQLEGFEIKFVNKEEITQEDRDAVPAEKQARKEKEEEERKQREEEERIKKEEEEKERLEKEEEEKRKKEEEEKEKMEQEDNQEKNEENGEEGGGEEEQANEGEGEGEEGNGEEGQGGEEGEPEE